MVYTLVLKTSALTGIVGSNPTTPTGYPSSNTTPLVSMDMVLKTTIEQWGSIMSNESVLRGLRAKVKDLAIKKREIDKEVESLHVVIGVFERNEQSQDSLNKDSFGEKIGTAIYGILHNEGGPLHRSEILSRIQEQGIHVGGKNPVNSVGDLPKSR